MSNLSAHETFESYTVGTRLTTSGSPAGTGDGGDGWGSNVWTIVSGPDSTTVIDDGSTSGVSPYDGAKFLTFQGGDMSVYRDFSAGVTDLDMFIYHYCKSSGGKISPFYIDFMRSDGSVLAAMLIGYDSPSTHSVWRLNVAGSDHAYPINQWNQLRFVLSTGGNSIAIYVNGSLVDSSGLLFTGACTRIEFQHANLSGNLNLVDDIKAPSMVTYTKTCSEVVAMTSTPLEVRKRFITKSETVSMTSTGTKLRKGIITKAEIVTMTESPTIVDNPLWKPRTKPTTTWTPRNKPTTNWTGRSKPSTTWTPRTKPNT
jgi:hypothetical protein